MFDLGTEGQCGPQAGEVGTLGYTQNDGSHHFRPQSVADVDGTGLTSSIRAPVTMAPPLPSAQGCEA